jgi:hypothetical protein
MVVRETGEMEIYFPHLESQSCESSSLLDLFPVVNTKQVLKQF